MLLLISGCYIRRKLFFQKMANLQIFKEKSGLCVCPIGPLLIVQMHSLEPVAFKRLIIHNFSAVLKKSVVSKW